MLLTLLLYVVSRACVGIHILTSQEYRYADEKTSNRTDSANRGLLQVLVCPETIKINMRDRLMLMTPSKWVSMQKRKRNT